jgi:hypothetical protein
MNSTGDARTSFMLDRVWRGDRWRFHGSTRLGSGGRKVSAESWQGEIVVRRGSEQDLLPMRVASARDENSSDANKISDGFRYTPSSNASPSPSASSRAMTRTGAAPAISIDGTVPGSYVYDRLPPSYDSLLDMPYRATQGGLTGERVPLDLSGGFLRRFSRDRLRGLPDSAALARLAQIATAQWLAYQLGGREDFDPGVQLVGERAIWALTRSTGRSVIPDITHDLASDKWRIRAYAAWVLGELRVQSAEAALIDALGDPTPRVRAMVAHALSQTRPAAARVPLEQLLGDSDYHVRAAVLEALAAIGDARSRDAIRALLNDPNAMVRANAEDAMHAVTKR